MKNSLVYLKRSEVSDFSSLLKRQHNAKVLTTKIIGDVEASGRGLFKNRMIWTVKNN